MPTGYRTRRRARLTLGVLTAATLLGATAMRDAVAQGPTVAVSIGGRDAGQVAYLGDSRLAAQFDDPAQLVLSARFFGNVAAQRLDRRLRTAVNLAVSGWRSDQYLSDEAVDRAIATKAGWVVIFGVLNDVAQRGPGDYFNGAPGGLPGGVRRQVLRLLEAGLRPILVLDPGAAGISGDAARTASLVAYNTALRTFAAEHPSVVLFDMPTVVVAPGDPHVYRPGYAADGTHLDNLGGIVVGRAFADLMSPLLPAETPEAPGPSLVPAGALGKGGGVAAERVKGDVPAGYRATCTPGVEARIAVQPAAEPAGGRMVMSLRATGEGRCTVTMDLADEKPGERYEADVLAEVDAGATGFVGPYLQAEFNRNGASRTAYDNNPGVGGPGPSDARTLHLRTPPIEVPEGERGWFMSALGVAFSGPGAATVTFREHRVGRLETR